MKADNIPEIKKITIHETFNVRLQVNEFMFACLNFCIQINHQPKKELVGNILEAPFNTLSSKAIGKLVYFTL